ncbi:MAG TPA: XRE family transcriptional regulator [Atopostipes sp.]|nr:XRE family transcriptional regulator [Atopostipes sp.]
MDLSSYIGNKLRYYRKENNMTQDELAQKLGLAKGTISNYESGYRTPQEHRLFELAEVLNISINDLFPPTTETDDVVKKITEISAQLEKVRQQKVYNLAERELEEQRSIQDHDYVGQTVAGSPIEGQQPVPMLGSDTVKLLVNGDSMEELFHDGDIVEYHPQPELENGEIGVFAVNGGVTMKKFRRNSDIRLESLNKKYQDIVIKETDDFNILGKVIL